MLSDELRKAAGRLKFVLLLAWLSEFLAFGVYYVVARFAVSTDPEGAMTAKSVLVGFVAMGGVAAIGGVALRHLAFSQARARTWLATNHPAPPNTPAKLSPGDAQLFGLAQSAFILFVMGMAMNNACAVFGLVKAFLAHDPNAVWPFFAAATAALALSFPGLTGFVEEAAAIQEQGS